MTGYCPVSTFQDGSPSGDSRFIVGAGFNPARRCREERLQVCPGALVGLAVVADVQAVAFVRVGVGVGEAVFGVVLDHHPVVGAGGVQFLFQGVEVLGRDQAVGAAVLHQDLRLDAALAGRGGGAGAPWKLATPASGRPWRAMSGTILPPKQ